MQWEGSANKTKVASHICGTSKVCNFVCRRTLFKKFLLQMAHEYIFWYTVYNVYAWLLIMSLPSNCSWEISTFFFLLQFVSEQSYTFCLLYNKFSFPGGRNIVARLLSRAWNPVSAKIPGSRPTRYTYRQFTRASFIPESAERIIYKQQVGQ